METYNMPGNRGNGRGGKRRRRRETGPVAIDTSPPTLVESAESDLHPPRRRFSAAFFPSLVSDPDLIHGRVSGPDPDWDQTRTGTRPGLGPDPDWDQTPSLLLTPVEAAAMHAVTRSVSAGTSTSQRDGIKLYWSAQQRTVAGKQPGLKYVRGVQGPIDTHHYLDNET
ncbi:uncharacterized protein V6R79_021731 [Siganus canaliculatus]